MQSSNFEEMIVKSYGIKGLRNKAISNLVLYSLRRIKIHFGVPISRIKEITERVL